MVDPARRRATYDDLRAAPEHHLAQLVDGELHVHPRPAGPHAAFASGLGLDIGNPFQRGRGGPGGWVFLFEPELHFGADVVVPDLAGWRAERAPAMDAAHFTVPPDWICEVVSPRSGRLDRGPKADLYARVGVAHLWLVEPEQNLVEAFLLVEGRWTRLGAWVGAVRARIPPFDAVELDLEPLWVIRPRDE